MTQPNQPQQYPGQPHHGQQYPPQQYPPQQQPAQGGPVFAHQPQQGTGATAPAPAPKKKRGWGKIIGGLVVLLLLLGAISQCGKGSASSSPTTEAKPAGTTAPATGATSAGAPAATTQATTKKAEPAKPTAAAIGAPTKSGELEFTVTDFKCGVTVESYQQLQPQGQFCRLGLTAKNVGTKQHSLSDSQVVVKDAKGAEYKSSSETWMVKDVILLKEINPGNTLTGAIYFDVPADVAPTTAELKGDLFAKPAVVALA